MNTRKIFGYGTQNLLCAFAVILALTALSLTGCDNGNDGSNNEHQTTTNVYVIGSYSEIRGYDEETNNPIYTSTACYWKNGVKTDLATGSKDISYYTRAIAVSGSDVYIVGYYSEITGYDEYNNPIYTYTVCYWKNGVKADLLTLNTNYPRVGGIAVSGSDVYITGCYSGEITGHDEYNNPIYTSTICYWKNGVKADLLTLNTNYPRVGGIAVSGSDVYITGYYNERTGYDEETNYPIYTYTTSYWKNGVKTDIYSTTFSAGRSDYAPAIAVSGSDVYITGCYSGETDYEYIYTITAYYWKNGVKTDIYTSFVSPAAVGGSPSAIAVSGSDVYVLASSVVVVEGLSSAPYYYYWKNGVRTDLPIKTYDATDIAVSGSDVYVAGSYYNDDYSNSTACYWKNGVKTDLPTDGNTRNARASAIAITVETRE